MADVLTTHSLQWADSTIERVHLDFDAVRIDLRDHVGRSISIACEGYVTFQVSGVWDDMQVDGGEVVDEDPLIAAAAARLESVSWSSGNVERDSRALRLLRLALGSGGAVECVAPTFAFTVVD